MSERKQFSLDDYVDVAQRISGFYEKYPDGRLVCAETPRIETIGTQSFIWYHARAYRTPDDPLPGDGWAAEPVPGPTPYTRDSELMNAETAAWGRAIVALGFSTKRIASRQEMAARSAPSGETATEPTQLAIPTTWAQVKELVEPMGPRAWEAFSIFSADASELLYGSRDSKEMSTAQRKTMLQHAAGAAVRLEELRKGDFPPPGRAEFQVAWARAVDGVILPGPEWLQINEEVAAEFAEFIASAEIEGADVPFGEEEETDVGGS